MVHRRSTIEHRTPLERSVLVANSYQPMYTFDLVPKKLALPARPGCCRSPGAETNQMPSGQRALREDKRSSVRAARLFWLCLTRAVLLRFQQYRRHVHPAEGLVQVVDAERAKRSPAPPESTLGSTTP